MTHFNGDKIKLVTGSSKTLKMSPKSVETLRSWRKYQENLYKVILFEPRQKRIFGAKSVLAKMNFVLKYSGTKSIALIERLMMKNMKAVMTMI